HAASVLSLTARHPAQPERLDFKRFIFGRAVGRAFINAGIGRMSALGANRTRRDSGSQVNNPKRTTRLWVSLRGESLGAARRIRRWPSGGNCDSDTPEEPPSERETCCRT